MQYVILGVILAAILGAILYTAWRVNEIKKDGIDTDAVVSRERVDESEDEDGHITTTSTWFVTYQTQDGQTVEAQLASGKAMDHTIGRKAWDFDLYEGAPVRIRYLPRKPDYVIRIPMKENM